MKIYTKTGDDGSTGLFNGTRVQKYSLRVETYGTIDELNTIVGLVTTYNLKEPLLSHLTILNNLLFNLGSDLATPLEPPPKFEVPRLRVEHIQWLEKLIDTYTDVLPKLNNFILPGGSTQASLLHNARTVCRRAERLAVKLAQTENIGSNTLIFINRLSDYLFTAARYANYLEGVSDVLWNKDLDVK